MPHVNSSGGDDLASSDEVKVYKDEGEEVEEKRSSENLSEDKLGLVTESEEEKGSSLSGQGYEKTTGHGSENGKPSDQPPSDRPGHPPGMGYVVTPYPYPNGSPLGLGNKLSVIQPPPHGALASLMMYNNDHFSQPPPAHMGIPPVTIDPKTGLPRPHMYAIPPPHSQFPHPIYPEFSNVQWNGPPGYPITAGGFRNPYSSTLSTSPIPRFGHHPGMLPHHPGLPHPGIPHPAIVTPGPKQEIPHHENNRYMHPSLDGRSSVESHPEIPEKKKPHIKKPLNAFMLFMKAMRAQVVAECTLKESAAINQILGRRWHALDREGKAKYYDMARKEKELHLQLYPGWSARDNYGVHTKRKKRKKETPGDGNQSSSECSNPKKCRARFGLDAQGQWCKPCRRKKKCIRFLIGDDGDGPSNSDDDEDDSDFDDNPNTPNSVGTVHSATDHKEAGSGPGTPHHEGPMSIDNSSSTDIVAAATTSSTATLHRTPSSSSSATASSLATSVPSHITMVTS